MKEHLASFARICGLWSIAVAQPLFDTLGRAPEFFVAQRADALDVLVLTGVLLIVPPAAVAVVVALASSVRRRAGAAVEGTALALLCAVVAVQVGYRAGISGWPGTVAVAAAAALLAGALWLRTDAFRTFVTILSAAALIVPLVFLMKPGIRHLVWRSGVHALGASTAASAPVVVLVFDELPLVSLLDEKGMLDAARYPHIAKLAADGIWFRNATTVSDYTRWALPAILSGRYPTPDSTPLVDHHPQTLFTLLGQSHRMEVFEPITAICPAELCKQDAGERSTRLAALGQDVTVVAGHVLLPPAARTGLPSLTANWAGFNGAPAAGDPADPNELPLWRRVWRRGIDEDHSRSALRFVDGITPEDPQPTVYFMHTLATHHPARWLPSGQAIANRRNIPGLGQNDVWTQDPWPPTQFYQGHLIQAGFADTLVGRMRERLERAGLYDRAVIVITSDHGISFRPGDQLRSVSESNLADIVPVPLIVKLPAGRHGPPPGTIDDGAVENVDILPTIAAAAGIELPWPTDGIPAIGERAGRREQRVYVDDARRVRRMDPADMTTRRAAALERKLELFGTSAWPAASVPDLRALLGRSVDTLSIAQADGGLRVHVDRPFAMQRVNLKAPALPVQVVGRIEPIARVSRDSVHLAVALNGTVVATTQTWTGQAGWLAMVPQDALRQGRNDLEVFLVDPSPAANLKRLAPAPRSPLGINLVFADYGEWGVEHEGLHGGERSGKVRFRWTDGSALIRVPLERGDRPSELQLDLRSGGQAGNELQVLVNDCPVLASELPGRAWSATVRLDRCGLTGGVVTIRLLSGTRQPGNDTRTLGVAVTRLMLK